MKERRAQIEDGRIKVTPLPYGEIIVGLALEKEKNKNRDIALEAARISQMIDDILFEKTETSASIDDIRSKMVEDTVGTLNDQRVTRTFDYSSLKSFFEGILDDSKGIPFLKKEVTPQKVRSLLSILKSDHKISLPLATILETKEGVEDLNIMAIWRELRENLLLVKESYEDFRYRFDLFKQKIANEVYPSDGEKKDLDFEDVDSIDTEEIESFVSASFEGNDFDNTKEHLPVGENFNISELLTVLGDSCIDVDLLPAGKDEGAIASIEDFIQKIGHPLSGEDGFSVSTIMDRIRGAAGYYEDLNSLERIVEAGENFQGESLVLKEGFLDQFKGQLNQAAGQLDALKSNTPTVSEKVADFIAVVRSFSDLLQKAKRISDDVIFMSSIADDANAYAREFFQKELNKSIRTMNHPDELVMIIDSILAEDSEKYGYLREAIVKLKIMHILYILREQRKVEKQEEGLSDEEFEERESKMTNYLREKFFRSIERTNKGYKLLTTKGDINVADVVFNTKNEASTVRKAAGETFVDRHRIFDLDRFSIKLTKEDSEKVMEDLERYASNGGSITSGAVEKIVGFVCAILGTDIDKGRLRSSLVTGGTQLASTGGHFALHITFLSKFTNVVPDRTIMRPIEFQLQLYNDEDDHPQYVSRKLGRLSHILSMNVGYAEHLVSMIDALHLKEKEFLEELDEKALRVVAETLLRAFSVREEDNKKLLKNGKIINDILVDKLNGKKLNKALFERMKELLPEKAAKIDEARRHLAEVYELRRLRYSDSSKKTSEESAEAKDTSS